MVDASSPAHTLISSNLVSTATILIEFLAAPICLHYGRAEQPLPQIFPWLSSATCISLQNFSLITLK